MFNSEQELVVWIYSTAVDSFLTDCQTSSNWSIKISWNIHAWCHTQ